MKIEPTEVTIHGYAGDELSRKGALSLHMILPADAAVQTDSLSDGLVSFVLPSFRS